MSLLSPKKPRLSADAGIALGPILFIIAILAILAAAIAAGSGSFNASTFDEGNKARASALIQIGDNLKVGMDRLTMENLINWNNWVISPANTTNNVDLYSPNGGAIAPPSVAMSGNPASDVWYYPQMAIPGLGTYAGGTLDSIQVAVVNVAPGVCGEINLRANGQNIAPLPQPLGNFALTTSNISSSSNTAWPNQNNAASLNLYGRPIGCVQNSDPGSSGYFFYEVLFIQ